MTTFLVHNPHDKEADDYETEDMNAIQALMAEGLLKSCPNDPLLFLAATDSADDWQKIIDRV